MPILSNYSSQRTKKFFKAPKNESKPLLKNKNPEFQLINIDINLSLFNFDEEWENTEEKWEGKWEKNFFFMYKPKMIYVTDVTFNKTDKQFLHWAFLWINNYNDPLSIFSLHAYARLFLAIKDLSIFYNFMVWDTNQKNIRNCKFYQKDVVAYFLNAIFTLLETPWRVLFIKRRKKTNLGQENKEEKRTMKWVCKSW